MTPQIFGTKKSNATRRVERYFKERKIEFQLIDVNTRAPSRGELEAIMRAVGNAETLIDPESREYKRRNLAYLDFDPIEEIEATPVILRLPIVRTDKGIAVDPGDAELAEIL